MIFFSSRKCYEKSPEILHPPNFIKKIILFWTCQIYVGL
ncbi:hypothetical protein UUU_35200 [Klebsiella pneumoniae subsp. pneumoniae DSM 30104 = JCM 1662 = NBRC 14940]|nr:hypothetical protein UUU_35200 [Klebsiella pneumoniae subsp. pneumoniae DSM 30104 = JCM 1662 = NBRC 14940]